MSTHRKPRKRRRLLSRLRVRMLPSRRRAARLFDAARRRHQAEAIDLARNDAFRVRIEPHAPPPVAWVRTALAARIAAIASQPPAAVLPDEADERWPHLGEGQYSGDDTQAFGMSIMKAGQQWMP